MTAADKPVPYHMRDDSDVEDANEAATADDKQSTSQNAKEKRQKDVAEITGGLKQLFGGKKPRLGNVEVDPNIGMSPVLSKARPGPPGPRGLMNVS